MYSDITKKKKVITALKKKVISGFKSFFCFTYNKCKCNEILFCSQITFFFSKYCFILAYFLSFQSNNLPELKEGNCIGGWEEKMKMN